MECILAYIHLQSCSIFKDSLIIWAFCTFPLTDSADFFPVMSDLLRPVYTERSEWSPHQTEHSDLPLAISISGANWRWFSITALKRTNRRIRVILSVWQAVIRGTIWRSLCFKWIIAACLKSIFTRLDVMDMVVHVWNVLWYQSYDASPFCI